LAEARFDRSVETSCYFCLRETLDNVARHAGGAQARVTVQREHDRLIFSVHDEGPGFDITLFRSSRGLQAMSDRIEASGGELEIESAPETGTTVRGWIPLEVSGYDEKQPQAEPVAAAQASSS
jgi:signal transduction histidine kinase